MDDILEQFKDKEAIIIDVRANSGGNSANAETIAGGFAGKKRLFDRFYKKTGSGTEMKSKNKIFRIMFFLALSMMCCKRTECPGMDQDLAAYVPEGNKATYISNTGKSFTVELEKFVTEDYHFVSSCDDCQCKKGAKVQGYTNDDMGNDLNIIYHITDDIYQSGSGIYQENGYFQINCNLRSYNAAIGGDAFNDVLIYKINFEQGLFRNILDPGNEYSKSIPDTTIDNMTFQDAMVFEEEIDTSYDGQVWKVVFAKNYGIAKFYISSGEEWTLKAIE